MVAVDCERPAKHRWRTEIHRVTVNDPVPPVASASVDPSPRHDENGQDPKIEWYTATALANVEGVVARAWGVISILQTSSPTKHRGEERNHWGWVAEPFDYTQNLPSYWERPRVRYLFCVANIWSTFS